MVARANDDPKKINLESVEVELVLKEVLKGKTF